MQNYMANISYNVNISYKYNESMFSSGESLIFPRKKSNLIKNNKQA